MASQFPSNVLDRTRRSRQPDLMRICPFATPGRFWRGNLHAHSNLSDGALNPRRSSRGINAQAITSSKRPITFWAGSSWPIAEHPKAAVQHFHHSDRRRNSRHGDERWRILAYRRDRAAVRLFPRRTGRDGPRLAERAGEGAFVAIADPSWSQLTIEDARLPVAHAVEVFNRSCVVLTDRGLGF